MKYCSTAQAVLTRNYGFLISKPVEMLLITVEIEVVGSTYTLKQASYERLL